MGAPNTAPGLHGHGPEGLTPPQIVAELDKFIVGQKAAKRAVAIALRNRWRRFQLLPELRDEVMPKNIILVGPTGVGKTEIARRLARLAQAPFLKVEASKFTEVGYVGRDVDSMIRDLAEEGMRLVREERRQAVRVKAREAAEERVLDLLLPANSPAAPMAAGFQVPEPRREHTREKLRGILKAGGLDDRTVEIEVDEKPAIPTVQLFGNQGMEELGMNLKEMFAGLNLGQKKGPGKKKKVTVPEAIAALEQEEAARLVDDDTVQRDAMERVQTSGIIFIDEIDKVASPGGGAGAHGPDVSRGGVQRDLLPIVEGSTVNTKYGPVKTDHILFIAAGAFHVSKVSDLLPELQGRFPIRVELEPLGEGDLVRILTQPQNSLTKQYTALLGSEGIELEFTASGAQELGRIAAQLNQQQQDIGARRLHAVVEKVLEEVSFRAAELVAAGERKVVVDQGYVREKLAASLADEDLGRYIL